MRGVFRPEPKFLAIITSSNSRRFSASAKIPGGNYQFACEVLSVRIENSWRYLPIWARGVCRLEPKFLAVFPSLYARCLSARTKFPGSIYQFKCEAILGQNPNSWRYFPVQMRGVIQSEPEFLAVFPSFSARCLSVRAAIPGDISSWNARCVSVRTKSPGGFYQFKCEAFVGPIQCSWRYLPIWMRGVRRSETKFLAVLPNLNAMRLSVRTEIPDGIYQCEREAFFGQNQNSPSEGRNILSKEEFFYRCDGFLPPITRFRDGFRPVLGRILPVAAPFCFRPLFGLLFVFLDFFGFFGSS